jgi:flagellar biosynthesis component FlhA
MSTVTAVSPAGVAVEVVLGSSVGRLFESDGQLRASLTSEVSRGLTGLLDSLGVPGSPSVRVASGEGDSLFQPVRVSVNGHVCRYPRELLWQAYGYARRVQPHPAVTENEISDWLQELSRPDEGAGRPQPGPLLEFIRLVCTEAVKIRPAVLLGSEQADAYLKALLASPDAGDGAALPDPESLTRALRNVLDQRISIADQQAVRETIRQEAARAASGDELSEALITALRPDAVQVLMSPQYLREMTLADEGDGREGFNLIRKQLFDLLGLTYPRFEFSPVDDFEPGTFAFKLNHLETAPYVGLRADTALVLQPPAALQELGVEARGAVNPLNGDICSVIELPAPGGEGWPRELRLWNQMHYVAFVLLGELRWKSGYFLDRETTRSLLAQLGERYPALAQAVERAMPVGQLTPVMRSLVTEDISPRHLRAVAERLLDYRHQTLSPIKFVRIAEGGGAPAEAVDAGRDNPDDLISFIRSGMKRYGVFRFTDDAGALNAYILDDDVERLLLERHSPPEELERVLEDIRHRLNSLPAFSSRPVILTSVETRATLRELLVDEFPRLQVISYNELTFNSKIQIIEKISLPEA